MPRPHTFPSASSSPAPNGTPERQGYTYRGTKREPADPAAVSERTRLDEGKQRAGAALRAARKAAGLSIRQAAEAAQVSAGYISAIECGHDWASERVIAALAAAYGITPTDLASAAESTPVAPGKPDEARPVPRAGRAASGPAQPAREAPALARPKTPGPVVEGKSAAGPGTSPAPLRGADWRKAAKAAQSDLSATQRRQGYRRSRDPYRNAVPGARKLPPERER